MVREVARAVRNGLVRLVVLGLGQLLLLLLLLVPGIGGPLWSVASWTWTALWLSAAHLDVPMARHLYSFDQELSVLRRRPLLCLGFGAAVALMLWVPVLNCFRAGRGHNSTVLFAGRSPPARSPPPERAARRGRITPWPPSPPSSRSLSASPPAPGHQRPDAVEPPTPR
jgi:hypothetical protein